MEEKEKERAAKGRVERKEKEKEVAGSRANGTVGARRIENGGRIRRMEKIRRARKRGQRELIGNERLKEERSYEGGEDALTWRDGFADFRRVAEGGRSLKEIGCILCWLVLTAESEIEKRRFSIEVLAPTGLTRDDIWRHLFLTKQRKNPYEEEYGLFLVV